MKNMDGWMYEKVSECHQMLSYLVKELEDSKNKEVKKK